MKGVSIPINTLVMLAVAIIVLLAAVAWFMGAFSPTASSQTYKQKFDNSCMQWVNSNCGGGVVPAAVCTNYNLMMGYSATASCTTNNNTIAAACGCIKPYGQ